jgi:hypothetical protein
MRLFISLNKIMTNIYFEAALPKYSAEERLRGRQPQLGVSASFIATLGGIQASTLSNAYRGIKPLENEKATELLSLTAYLMELQDALKPFSCPLTNAAETRKLIDHLQKMGVTPEKIRAAISKLLAGEE